MIWTEEENENRELQNILNPKGKYCSNCHWGNTQPGDDFATCGHHIQNFSIGSFCGAWTDPKDPKLREYIKARKDKLSKQIKDSK